jgi:hypothetical protein
VRRRRRVRVHTIDPGPGVDLPSFEGVLLGSWLSRRLVREVRLGDAAMLAAAGARPEVFSDAREVRVNVDRVAFYEVLR